MDIFSWSIPFVVEKVLDVMMNILQRDKPGEEKKAVKEEEEKGPALSLRSPEEEEKMKKRQMIRRRVQFVGKMAKMMRTLREERETVVKLKGLAPDNKIPMGLLTAGHDALETEVSKFEKARSADLANEKRPDA